MECGGRMDGKCTFRVCVGKRSDKEEREEQIGRMGGVEGGGSKSSGS